MTPSEVCYCGDHLNEHDGMHLAPCDAADCPCGSFEPDPFYNDVESPE